MMIFTSHKRFNSKFASLYLPTSQICTVNLEIFASSCLQPGKPNLKRRGDDRDESDILDGVKAKRERSRGKEQQKVENTSSLTEEQQLEIAKMMEQEPVVMYN